MNNFSYTQAGSAKEATGLLKDKAQAAYIAGGTTLLDSSHVMDEATRCDRLVLLREGQVLADVTPEGLLARTGAADADAAFLALIDAETKRSSERSAS